MSGSMHGYPPISDYGIIGDAHTAALVSREGSIDWCCWPDFDSPAVFCRLLDLDKGGCFRLTPTRDHSSTRAYVEGTNVLQTTFSTATGRVCLTDLMPIERLTSDHQGEDIGPSDQILRVVEGIAGEVQLALTFKPTFDYARAQTRLEIRDRGAVATWGREALVLSCPAALTDGGEGALIGRFHVRAGERFAIELVHRGDGPATPRALTDRETDAALRRTLDYWKEWSGKCPYDGPYGDLVRRSALTLKLLTFEPTGALVAAPTTSLPEDIGGVRNWDYRFTWLRDATLILQALLELGYREEAVDFFGWLEALPLGGDRNLQIMYTISGHPALPEQELTHLDGYARSRPVRIGNAASHQNQLDIYGEVLSAAALCYERVRPIGPALWSLLGNLVEQARSRWREPDSGIWEIRLEPQHYLYSKLLCWVALDRGIHLAEHAGMPGDLAGWRRSRDEIRHAILTEGYDAGLRAFTQALGKPDLDASALAIPLVGFLPADDPRVRSTMDRISERLMANGLVYRYRSGDGLPGGEGVFALCSFWLVDNLALAGRVDEARRLFERILGYANDLGLLSEEVDPRAHALLGNFPQGFTHLALVRSALHIARAAERPGEPFGALTG